MRPQTAIKRVVQALDSDFCRAFAEPARLEVISALLQEGGAGDITCIAAHLSQDRSVVSRHLKVLLDAGVVRVEKQGRNRVYQLEGRPVIDRFERIVQALRDAMPACCPD